MFGFWMEACLHLQTKCFVALKRTEDVLVRKFDAAFNVSDHRIAAMEEKFHGSPARDDRTPPSGKKRKIAQLRDLSVSK